MSLRSIPEISSHTRMPPDGICHYDDLPVVVKSIVTSNFVLGAFVLSLISLAAYSTFRERFSINKESTLPDGLKRLNVNLDVTSSEEPTSLLLSGVKWLFNYGLSD